MKTKKLPLLALFLLSVFMAKGHPGAGASQPTAYDICVYGDTPAGVMAAISAARLGKKVILLAQNAHVGGVMTSGLTATDMNRYTIVGGIPREMFQRLYTYYEKPAVWRNQTRDEFFELSKNRSYTGKNDKLKIQWVYESHVLENIMLDMLKEAGVHVVYNQQLNLTDGVTKKGKTITSIRMTSGQTYSASYFIDATYEGDLMAKSGVSYVVGREPEGTYKESLAGVTTASMTGVKITFEGLSFDPYVKEGDPASGLLPFVDPKGSLKPSGTGDHKLQAFTYRLTLTNDRENRIPIAKPANYNPLWYEFMARRFKVKSDFELFNVITVTPMPNKKTDTNHLDMVGASYAWAEADHETRRQIAAMHREYALGKLWFLANDERVPAYIRSQMKEWGLAKDEFTDNGNFPYQIYVREARRMVGDYVMTEHNCKRDGKTHTPTSVGMGSYAFDTHGVARFVNHLDSVQNEGFLYSTNVSAYPISYSSIVPKSAECTNLVVPVCLSASHVAFSSIRMEPVYLVLGHSAGTAAALSHTRRIGVQQLPYKELRQQLLTDGQILE